MRTDKDWVYLGEADAFFAVASLEGKEAGSPNAWTAADFIAFGASDFSDVLSHWRHFGLIQDRCIEIGCGAGRITVQLAKTFKSVLALDVSAHQIERARALLGGDAERVEFELVNEPLVPAPSESCDAMFSCHVFQHLPGEREITSYLRETFRVLRPGGSVCFHIPVPGAHLTSGQSQLWYVLRNLYKQAKRVMGVRGGAEYHRYRIADVFALLTNVGFRGAEVRVFPMRSNGDYHSYFFARKPDH